MKTYNERRVDKLQRKLRNYTKADGSPRRGMEQVVASVRAELEVLSESKGMGDD